MAAAFIFLGMIFVYLLLLTSFLMQDYLIGMMAGMGLLIIGIYGISYNIEGINNLLTYSFSVISIGIGAYIFIQGSVDQITDIL